MDQGVVDEDVLAYCLERYAQGPVDGHTVSCTREPIEILPDDDYSDENGHFENCYVCRERPWEATRDAARWPSPKLDDDLEWSPWHRSALSEDNRKLFRF